MQVNALGQPIAQSIGGEGAEVLAWYQVNDALEVVYQREPEQIKLLIKQLKKESEEDGKPIDANLLTEEYWMTTSCTKRDGRCQGNCRKGSCQECCTRSCYCCCR